MNAGTEVALPSTADISSLLQAHLSDFLLRPGAPSLGLVRHQLRLGDGAIRSVEAEQQSLPIDLRQVFQGALGCFVFCEYERACALLPTYDRHKMVPTYSGRGAEFFQKYFCMSMTRVYHVLEMLLGFGAAGGAVLEIGSLFGTFSGALQRAGYQVTAIDRYKTFGGSLDAYIADMRSSGNLVACCSSTRLTSLGIGTDDIFPKESRSISRLRCSSGRKSPSKAIIGNIRLANCDG
jgi:hypothetical protein